MRRLKIILVALAVALFISTCLLSFLGTHESVHYIPTGASENVRIYNIQAGEIHFTLDGKPATAIPTVMDDNHWLYIGSGIACFLGMILLTFIWFEG